MFRFLLPAAFAASLFAAHGALAATTIDVTLWDKGATAEMMTGLAYGAAPADLAHANMGVKLSVSHLPAGEVTFKATNSSKDTIHEMLVFAMKGDQPPPYLEDQGKLDEEAGTDLGEVSELDPGKSGSLTLTLAPGKYLVACNVPFHYVGGMWAVLTVDPAAPSM